MKLRICNKLLGVGWDAEACGAKTYKGSRLCSSHGGRVLGDDLILAAMEMLMRYGEIRVRVAATAASSSPSRSP